MQGFVFIYILLGIILIIGVIITWKLNKKIFQIIAEERQEALYFLQGKSSCWVRSSQPPIPSVECQGDGSHDNILSLVPRKQS